MIFHFLIAKTNTSKEYIPFTDIHINLMTECIFSIYDYLNTYYHEKNESYKNIDNFLTLADDRINAFQFKKFNGNLNGKRFQFKKIIGISDNFYNLNDNNLSIFIHTVIHEFLHAMTPYGLNSYYNVQDKKPETLNALFTLLFGEKYIWLMEYANEKVTIQIVKKYFIPSHYEHHLHIYKNKKKLRSIEYKNYAVDYKELVVCEDLFYFFFGNNLEESHLSDTFNIKNILKEKNLESWTKYLKKFLKMYKKLYNSGGNYNESCVQYTRYIKLVNAYYKMAQEYLSHRNLSNNEKNKFIDIVDKNPLYSKSLCIKL